MQTKSDKKALFFYAMAAFCIAVTINSNAVGDIIRVDLYGEVTSVVDPAGILGGQISVYDEITGFYRFDTSIPDSNPSSSNEGEYHQMTAGYGISLNINGLMITTNLNNPDFLIRVINDSAGKDSYLLYSTSNLQTSGGLTVSSIRWLLEDGSCTALNSDALVAAIPWQWGSNILELTMRGSDGTARVMGIIPYAEVVPEPATVVLMWMGTGILIFKGRERR